MNERNRALIRALVRDLVVDYRCALRDGLPEYAAKCRSQALTIFRNRHTAKLDRFGWPTTLLREQEKRS